MTIKVCKMLEQVSALKEYLEEHSEELSDGQAERLQQAVDMAWAVACRRTKDRQSY